MSTNCNLAEVEVGEAGDCALNISDDICQTQLQILRLPPLVWSNWNNLNLLKLTNTGQTVMITVPWKENRPVLQGGPLQDEYTLGQVHFHWSTSGNIPCSSSMAIPLEMHVVLFKSVFLKLKAALKETDAIAVFVYTFQVGDQANQPLNHIVENLDKVQHPDLSTSISAEVLKLAVTLPQNYYISWGSLVTKKCEHNLWLVVFSTSTVISLTQMIAFKKILTSLTMANSNCSLMTLCGRRSFYVPARSEEPSLLEFNRDQLLWDSENIPENTYLTSHHSSPFCCLSPRKRIPITKFVQEKNKKTEILDLLDKLEKVNNETKQKMGQLERETKEFAKKKWLKRIKSPVETINRTASTKSSRFQNSVEALDSNYPHDSQTYASWPEIQEGRSAGQVWYIRNLNFPNEAIFNTKHFYSEQSHSHQQYDFSYYTRTKVQQNPPNMLKREIQLRPSKSEPLVNAKPKKRIKKRDVKIAL